MKKLLIILIISLCTNFDNAQWQQTNGPFGCSTNCIVTNGSYTFTLTNTGIYFLQKNDTSWLTLPSNNDLTNINVNTLAMKDSNLYLGSLNNGIYLSTNYGTNWNNISNNLPYGSSVGKIIIIDTNIFALTYYNGIYYSSINSNYNLNLVNGSSNLNIFSLAIKDTTIFVLNYGGGVHNKF